MKILHTADWHLGKHLNNFNLLEDQRHILQQFISLAKAHKPDIILLAGDVYDRSMPPADAIKLFDEVMSEIILVLKIPVIAIAGNHDNAQRVGYCNAILEKQGLYMFGQLGEKPLTALPQITLNDEFGEVHFFPIPYTEPETLRHLITQEATETPIRTHQDVMKWITDKIETQCPTGRRIIIGHAFVAGGEASDSERDLLMVGGAAHIEANTFEKFTYTALGHLHRPQNFGQKVRYAGSPLKYSFSEAHHAKSVTLFTLDANGVQDNITQIPLIPLRDMHRVKGVVEDFAFRITSAGSEHISTEDFLEVTLENEQNFLNPMSIVQKSYKNAMHLRRAESTQKRKTQGIDANNLKHMTEADLFTAFFKRCHADKDLTTKQLGFLHESIKVLREKV